MPQCRAIIDSRFSDTFNLQLVLSGKMYFSINHGEQVVFDHPTIFWHLPENTYQYGPVDKHGWYHNWFTFHGQRAKEIMYKGFNQLSAMGYSTVCHPEDVREIFQGIIHYLNDDYPKYHIEAVTLLEKLLCILYADKKTERMPSRYNTELNRLGAEIRKNPILDYNFKNICVKMGLSYSHFRQCFREHFGRSPRDFLLYCRMKTAAERLQDMQMTIQEIAYEFGYHDQAQFSKIFKNKIGLYPRQYRNSLPVK